MAELNTLRIDRIKEQVNEIASEQKRVQSMLRALIEHNRVPWEDQDQFN